MSEIDKLARRIQAAEGQIRALGASLQLAHSSIVDGAVDQTVTVEAGVDELGNQVFGEQLASRYGAQEDGSNTVVVFTGPTPPRPVGHTVSSGAGFLTVEWFGLFEDRFEPYLDHDHVAVHVGTTAGFTPSADTLKATIRARQGEMVTVSGLAPGTYFVSLVAVAQSGLWGPPAPYVSGASGEPSGVDVTAREMAAAASAAAAAAQADATAALTAADGKTRLWYATVAPVPGDGADGDMWWQRDPATQTVTAVYEKRAGVWEPRKLTSAVIDSVTAGQITTGTLQAGATINVGDPSGPHTALGGTSLVTYRLDPDGDLTPTIVIGGATADVVQIVDSATGETVAGFASDGTGVAKAFTANQMTVNGSKIGDPFDPDDLLWNIPRGAIGSFAKTTSGGVAGTNPLGVCEVASRLQGGRLYRVSWTGTVLWGTAGGIIRLQLTDTFDGTAPTVNSAQRLFANEHMSINSSKQVSVSTYFTAPSSDPANWYTYRCLFGTWAAFAGYTVQAFANSVMPMAMTVEDVGPIGAEFMKAGQASYGGGSTAAQPGTTLPPPAVAVKTQKEQYIASWNRTFDGDGDIRTDNNNIYQGYYSARGVMRSMIGFPAQMVTDLAGATISKMEAYLYAYHWWAGSGGTAVLGVHGAASPPAVFSYSGSLASTGWPRNAYRWVPLPAAWYEAFTTGVNRGITLGGGVGASTIYYGTFYPYTKAQVQPKLRVTFTK